MRRIIYVDTSALAKWYLNESRFEDVERYIQENAPVDISDLTGVEMRSLLGRRRREGNIDPTTEMKVFSVFEEDVRQQFLIRHPIPSGTAAAAVHCLPLSRRFVSGLSMPCIWPLHEKSRRRSLFPPTV